jgi:RNA polymerase-interacting CarD/CdnL/TRCF family regulator
MSFHVGDQVIHWYYGLGQIVQTDEKILDGHTQRYFVVKIRDLTLWVPDNADIDSVLRFPTPAKEFDHLFAILSSPPEPLVVDRMARKNQLSTQLKIGSLDPVCRMLRDLTYQRKTKGLNEYDKSALERLKGFLLDEWTLSLSVPLIQARKDLAHLLNDEL